MRSMILDLTRQIAELRVTVEFLRTENINLSSKTPSKRTPKTKQYEKIYIHGKSN